MHPVPGARKVVTEGRHLRNLHGEKPTQEFGKGAEQDEITTDPRNRMNPRYQTAVWLGM